MERELQVEVKGIGENEQSRATGFAALKYTFKSEQSTLQLVDYLLSKNQGSFSSLTTVLTEAGSAWTVGERYPGVSGLVARVPEGVQDAVDLIRTKGQAGRRLSEAWGSAFGINPNATAAYSAAVKAVEDAAIPVISPKDGDATLGKLIGQMSSGGKFNLPNLREHSDATSHDVLVSMMRLLWTGQHDRHGGPSSVGVPNVTQDEAESAVILAVTLVGWFETGKVVR